MGLGNERSSSGRRYRLSVFPRVNKTGIRGDRGRFLNNGPICGIRDYAVSAAALGSIERCIGSVDKSFEIAAELGVGDDSGAEADATGICLAKTEALLIQIFSDDFEPC